MCTTLTSLVKHVLYGAEGTLTLTPESLTHPGVCKWGWLGFEIVQESVRSSVCEGKLSCLTNGGRGCRVGGGGFESLGFWDIGLGISSPGW